MAENSGVTPDDNYSARLIHFCKIGAPQSVRQILQQHDEELSSQDLVEVAGYAVYYYNIKAIRFVQFSENHSSSNLKTKLSHLGLKHLSILKELINYIKDINMPVSIENTQIKKHLAIYKNEPLLFITYRCIARNHLFFKQTKKEIYKNIIKSNLFFLKLLLDSGANPNYCDETNLFPHIFFTDNSHTPSIELLIKYGADVNFFTKSRRNTKGSSAIVNAIRKHWLVLAKTLLKHGARVEAYKEKALFDAAFISEVKTFKNLLKFGADLYERIKNGNNILHAMAIYKTLSIESSKDVQQLIKFAIKSFANDYGNLNEKNHHGLTPLNIAIQGNRNLMVRELLKHGANANIPNSKGNYPIHFATRNNSLAIVKLLLEEKCWVNTTSNSKLKHTPLHIAAFYGHNKIAKLLLGKGAAVNLTTKKGMNALQLSVLENHFKTAKILLKYGANPNHKRNDGHTSLHIACLKSEDKMVKLLLQHHADFTISGSAGYLPIHIAAIKNSDKKIKLLIKYGCDIDATNNENLFTALHCSIVHKTTKTTEALIKSGADYDLIDYRDRKPIHLAIECGNTLAVILLLKKGVDVNSRTKTGNTPLHYAASCNRYLIAEMLLRRGADVNIYNREQSTPLILAVDKNNLKITKILLQCGANPNMVDKNGYTSLHIAIAKRNYETAKVLLENGANPNIAISNGMLPINVAACNGFIEGIKLLINDDRYLGNNPLRKSAKTPSYNLGRTVLHDAAHYGRHEAIRLFLQHDSRDINASTQEDNNTPLHEATIYTNDIKTLELLLAAEANPNVRNVYGYTPLYIAAWKKKTEFVRLLLQYNASYDIPSFDGEYPIYVAAQHGAIQAAELLVAAGANVDAATKDRLSPLHAAAANGNHEIINILVSKKANLNIQTSLKRTALHVAIKHDNWRCAFELVKSGADLALSNNNGDTALHLAVNKHNSFLVKLLLAHGANPLIKNKDGASSLSIAKKYSTASHLSIRKKCIAVSKIIEEYIDVKGKFFYKKLLSSGYDNSSKKTPAKVIHLNKNNKD